MKQLCHFGGESGEVDQDALLRAQAAIVLLGQAERVQKVGVAFGRGQKPQQLPGE